MNYAESFVIAARVNGMSPEEYDQALEDALVQARIRAKSAPPSKRPIKPSTRTRIFCRDLHQCQYCGARDKPLAVDHVHPESRGGSHTDDNFITACRSCNTAKRNYTIEEFRTARERKTGKPVTFFFEVAS